MMSSTSKRINTSATKKKCRLNFRRKSLYVLKPHSNGLWSSRSKINFLETIFPRVKNINDNKRAKNKSMVKK